MTAGMAFAEPGVIGKGDTARWQQIAHRHQSHRSACMSDWSLRTMGVPLPSLPPISDSCVRDWPTRGGNLDSRQQAITESVPSRLLDMMAKAIWSAEEVLTAFIARAVIAHHLTNPITEPLFEQALCYARQLDAHLEATGKPIGPLHGLPMSLKDVMNIRGHASTKGFIALADVPMETSDELVERLAAIGAVFYCKTNVPQSLMSGECVNFLYGRTSTPDNRKLSAGGSSGGEGSLIALGGSPLGIGTDIAGSIRTPANFNGIYGLCPTYGRFPLHSVEHSGPTHLINPVAGPLSRSIDGLEVYARSLLGLKPWNWDFSCVKLPWNESLYQDVLDRGRRAGISFGFVKDDGRVQPHPPIQRGMRELRNALLEAGHDVVDVQLFDGREGFWETALSIYFCDGSRNMLDMLARTPEPMISEISPPPQQTKAISAEELLEQGRKLQILRQLLLTRWQKTAALTRSTRPVDVFILPSGGHVAPPHGTMEYFLYEAISNLLDWTCATIPVGNVDPALDAEDSVWDDFVALSEEDLENRERWSLEAYNNGAICLQVLGQRYTEEKVLACLRAIDAALGRCSDHVS